MRRTLSIPLLALVLAAFTLGALATGCGSESDSSTNGGASDGSGGRVPQMPEFTLDRLGGGELTEEDILGKPTVVNFEGSWCGPCEFEAPAFASVSASNSDVAFVGIAVKDSDEAQQLFIDKHGWTFPIGMDYTGEVVTDFQREALVPRGAIPMTFFIDSTGLIFDVWIGPILEDDLNAKIAELLDFEALNTATGTTGTGTATESG